ncbi:hypothetical protein [Ferrimonas balearica]|uniref:hypothetical protein n=1 Tax=Ferrimonas balearica TaxID=44012 RepID=UPI001C999525|nr:hypothetical protein [Ferrimonas balearica]MBY5920885.1 hypothetical protein [Ferrimonas balearica]MBY5996430.1 hypothetical protein [Ferrimonas balearica]
MFQTEDEMQALVDGQPEVILSGIPEINPDYCPDASGLLSLGREIPLSSGSLDNLFIDVNAVLTLVECKRYSDARLKREVYPQAINYASDLKSQLIHYEGNAFCEAFGELLSGSKGAVWNDLDKVMDALSKDPVLEGKNLTEWRRQFVTRLEHNIKSGICRIVMLCAPAPDSAFNYRSVRNLMQLMSFSEAAASGYDIVLMDLREQRGMPISRIMWRRHATLPLIPLIAELSRDTSASIGRMRGRMAGLPFQSKITLERLIDALSEHQLMVIENTFGYAIKSAASKRSIYTKIVIGEGEWRVIRHQIRNDESIYSRLDNGALPESVRGFATNVTRRESTLLNGQHFEIEVIPDAATDIPRLAKWIAEVSPERTDGRPEAITG